MITTTIALLAILALAASATADPIMLDFEGFPATNYDPGEPIPAANRLSTQYLTTHGVKFSSDAPYVGVVALGADHATSGTMGLSGATLQGTTTYAGTYFVAEFFDPINTANQAVTDSFSVRGDLRSDGSGGTLRAFDVNDQLIAQQFIPDVSGSTFTLSAPGIHKVTFTGSGSIALDDLSFNTVTPFLDPNAVQAVIYPAVEVAWSTAVGQTYQVQFTPSLAPATWTNFGIPIQGDGTEKSIFDQTRNSAKRFYRVLKVP